MIHEPILRPNEPPFIAEVIHEPTSSTHFVTRSRIVLGASIDQMAHDLNLETLGVLTLFMDFVKPNGAVGPSAEELARALGHPVWQIRLRLLRLARQQWRGQPLLRVVRRPSNRETFHPGPAVLGLREARPIAAALPSVAPADREQVLDASRRAYARPKEIVEQEIRALQGWPHPTELRELREAQDKPPSDLNERWAVERLSKEKVDYSLALKLVKEYGAERCLKQLKLLPYRKGIKNKARYIVGAIQADYAAPEILE
jgi:hypothetical protein